MVVSAIRRWMVSAVVRRGGGGGDGCCVAAAVAAVVGKAAGGGGSGGGGSDAHRRSADPVPPTWVGMGPVYPSSSTSMLVVVVGSVVGNFIDAARGRSKIKRALHKAGKNLHVTVVGDAILLGRRQVLHNCLDRRGF